MHLKRLTLHGFKTFADKTEVQFSPSVTCIVGPNGSGKSSLLDALVWCLGEQKASSLRAGSARDVIFAGSSKRRAMGMAEVSLTVDSESVPSIEPSATPSKRPFETFGWTHFLEAGHLRRRVE